MTTALEQNAVLVDRFKMEKCLASGGYGDVWKGIDQLTGDPVAVKILRNDAGNNDPSAIARMRQEAEMLQKIRHPNVVDIIGYYQTDYGDALVMEYLNGMAIDQLIVTRGPAEHDEAVAAAREILSALAACHAKGVVHRDLKPENIIQCMGSEGRMTMKLLDFGIAKATELLSDDESGVTLVQTRAGGFMGTPRYAAPEQVVGDPFGANIDLYSFGLVLAEWLTGRPRMDAETHGDVMAQVLSPDPIDISDVPYRWREWLTKMVARNPKSRLKSAAVALTEFEELVIRLHQPADFLVSGFQARQPQSGYQPQQFSSQDLMPDFAKVQNVPAAPQIPQFNTEEQPPPHELFQSDEPSSGMYIIAILVFVMVVALAAFVLF